MDCFKDKQKKRQASELWLLRRMLKISWTEKKSNQEVLNMAGIGRQLLKTLCKWQLEYFGHVGMGCRNWFLLVRLKVREQEGDKG